MGLLAVLGAIVVGIMQVRILKRQSEIAADQYQLQQQQLRSELYQNRAEVYAVAHDWFDVALSQNQLPSLAMEREFKKAVGAAEFLFRDEVSDSMRSWFLKTGRYFGQRDAGNMQEAMHLESELRGEYEGLQALFEPEMRLGEQLESTDED
ncbi:MULTISPECIES: hypothetical protein [unclassified Hyphomonas]|uniref:hypothetical protein n=1 Tax=unclassified Hyphomonas TaxID=2630699 RepID=UPI000C943D6E|nr:MULTISPECIES: hypothetical protein [unclassified Hyphomonas]MAL44414.1 hypothetical protein [Hyphomonas sp.]HAO36816.1 hypothetical protein [Hyphomonas sp.]HAW56834.1 hypothetical protein [Hyphomonas sp.]HBJ40557.1 hypothetical protein [Hyphomonas sp.]HBU33978.1 hypothetical protein [Hyphomonas sp.]